jgi:nitroreductase
MAGTLLQSRDVQEDDFPLAGAPQEKLRFLLNYAILAPSSHNTQPWLFHIRGEAVSLYSDRRRSLPVVDPFDRELVISCGAALYNLRAALRHFGYEGEVAILPDPYSLELLANVGLGGAWQATEEEEIIFHEIERRRTNRKPFEKREVPEEVLAELWEAARQEGAWLHVVEGEETRNALADLIAEGDRTQWADEWFRREVADWARANWDAAGDGIPGYAMGYGDIKSLAGPLVLRTFDMGKGQAARDRQLAEGSPALAVLGTTGDQTPDWLAAGQALQKVLLAASARGISASFLNQPVEIAELRPVVRDLIPVKGYPQIVLRLGYGPEVRPTPRRPLSDTLV